MKISFLIPNTWTASEVATNLSLDFLQGYYYDLISELDVVIYENDTWEFSGLRGVDNLETGTDANNESIMRTTIASDQFDQGIHVSYSNPMTCLLYTSDAADD